MTKFVHIVQVHPVENGEPNTYKVELEKEFETKADAEQYIGAFNALGRDVYRAVYLGCVNNKNRRTGISYILVIWTIVGYAGTAHIIHEKYDWRPIGEFHQSVGQGKNAIEMCEDAARQLAVKADRYRCVRSK